MVKIPRIMLAATHSGAGKTTLSTALMATLSKDFKVQPFKVGPDYIDPTYHSLVCGRTSRNLDSFLLSTDDLHKSFYLNTRDVDISIIEGVMGLYDGFSSTDDRGSSAAIAKLLKIPIILVMDVKSTARSAAATLLGFQKFDPDVNIVGVILNKIGSQRHYQLVKEAIEYYCQVPVVGYVNKNTEFQMPERHLGLVPVGEEEALQKLIHGILPLMVENIDLNLLLELSNKAPELNLPQVYEPGITVKDEEKIRIAVAQDKAFSFYYQDGLDYLISLGAEIVPFSPIRDKTLPENIHGLYIGGGFPELYLAELSSNKSIQQAIQTIQQGGIPILAECGGFMYLTEGIVNFTGNKLPLVGLIQGYCAMEKRLVKMGYMEGIALQDNLLLKKGQIIRGHEFHYSSFHPRENTQPWAWSLRKQRGDTAHLDGFATGRVLATYLHVNLLGEKTAAANFINQCRLYKAEIGEVKC